MRNLLTIIGISFILLISCAKEEVIDLSYLCDNGGLWLIDKKDSFNPIASIDTFLFNQGGGFHRFIFTNSGVNRLQIDVRTKPDSGKTFVYQSKFIREISGTYISEQFNYSVMKDSMLTIQNNGNHYIVTLKPVQAQLGTSKSIELRACKLRMNDVTP